MTDMDRIEGALIGHLIADAAGCPYEFKTRGTFTVSAEMIGWGTHSQPPGEWTDDGALTLAGVDAALHLRDHAEPSSEAAWLETLRFGADAHAAWLEAGRYHRRGVTFDVGGQTSGAIRALGRGPGVDLTRVPNHPGSSGNGGLMRILGWIFAVRALGLPDAERERRIADACRLTHPTPISLHACWIYADVLDALLAGASGDDAIQAARSCHNGRPEIAETALLNAMFDDVAAQGTAWQRTRATGYVLDSLHIALAALTGPERGFIAPIREVIALGGDTDTNAAIAAGLLGARMGLRALTEEAGSWIDLTFDAAKWPYAGTARDLVRRLAAGRG